MGDVKRTTSGGSFGAQSGLDRSIEPAGAPLRTAGWLCALIFAGAPIAQAAIEIARSGRVQAFDYFRPLARAAAGRPLRERLAGIAAELASASHLRDFERELQEASRVRHDLLPAYQWALTAWLRFGNKRVVVGRDDWLFYADDLESVYGRGFLEPGVGGREALAAIEDFKARLDRRGIHLLLIPSLSKEMLDPDRLSRFTEHLESAANPDLARFHSELERRGIDFVRMDELLAQCRAQAADRGAPLALPRDTHWSPATMAFCAERIARRARDLLGEPPRGLQRRFEIRRAEIEGQGDLLRMLGLPDGQTLYPPMRLELEQVVDRTDGALVRPSEGSDVLVMGDSLTRVFSDPGLALGEGAGLAEHLALHLDRPLDVIALAGGSATATRQALARRADGLRGKKLVIWQFGVRMLASGPDEWRIVKLPEPAANPFGAPPPLDVADVPRDRVTFVGEIVETSSTGPHFDYDFVLLVHELRVIELLEGTLDGERAWVAFPAIVNGKDQPARSFRVGERHRISADDWRLHFNTELVPWFDDTDAGRLILYPLEHAPAGR